MTSYDTNLKCRICGNFVQMSYSTNSWESTMHMYLFCPHCGSSIHPHNKEQQKGFEKVLNYLLTDPKAKPLNERVIKKEVK